MSRWDQAVGVAIYRYGLHSGIPECCVLAYVAGIEVLGSRDGDLHTRGIVDLHHCARCAAVPYTMCAECCAAWGRGEREPAKVRICRLRATPLGLGEDWCGCGRGWNDFLPPGIREQAA